MPRADDRRVRKYLSGLVVVLIATLASTSGFAQADGTASASPAPAASSSSPAPGSSSGAAPAAAPTPEDAARLEAAREQYRQGVAAFHARHFGDAVIAFERSYALRPHPLTLYNAAEARFRAGDRDRSLEQLRQLLAMTSPAPDAATIERAHALAREAGVDNIQPAEAHATECPVCPTCAAQQECPPAPPPRVVAADHGVLPYALAAVGFVAFGIGMAFYGHALGDSAAYNSTNDNSRALLDELKSRGTTFTAVGVVGIIVGVLAEAGAVILYMRSGSSPSHAARARPSRPTARFDIGPLGVSLSGTF